jgi:hypothetical protein
MRRIAASTGLPFSFQQFDSLTEDETAALKQKVGRHGEPTASHIFLSVGLLP